MRKVSKHTTRRRYKTCAKCGKRKVTTSFDIDRSRRDNLDRRCKVCKQKEYETRMAYYRRNVVFETCGKEVLLAVHDQLFDLVKTIQSIQAGNEI